MRGNSDEQGFQAVAERFRKRMDVGIGDDQNDWPISRLALERFRQRLRSRLFGSL
jgi:hypothetical protein